jgi:DNA-directed RNA polymerase subunit L
MTMKTVNIHSIEQNKITLTFDIENVNVSVINAIRRTLLSDIPCCVFRTTPHDKNNVNIHINTSRLNNEIIKHRMSCIPIHITDLDESILNRYIIEIDVENTTDTTLYVTTKDIKIKDIETDTYMDKEGVRKVFPPNQITGDYIIITRLRPKLSDSIPGEHLKLSAKLAVSSAKDDSCFVMASTASYGMTPDPVAQEKGWRDRKNKLISEGMNEEELAFEEKNWYIHEGKRHYKEDSFQFILETIGVYENMDLLHTACSTLIDKLQFIYTNVQSGNVPVNEAQIVEAGYDIILKNEDYTIGKCLEYAFYEEFFKKSGIINLVAFEKTHPLNDYGVLRVIFSEDSYGKEKVFELLMSSCEYLIRIFESIKEKLVM